VIRASYIIFFTATFDLEMRPGAAADVAGYDGGGGEEARKLRVRVGGVPTPKKVRPFTGVRGIAEAVLDRRRWNLGQCNIPECRTTPG
jgi:hypothetical protein